MMSCVISNLLTKVNILKKNADDNQQLAINAKEQVIIAKSKCDIADSFYQDILKNKSSYNNLYIGNNFIEKVFKLTSMLPKSYKRSCDRYDICGSNYNLGAFNMKIDDGNKCCIFCDKCVITFHDNLLLSIKNEINIPHLVSR